jgi:tetratricopeptide (TPR) repeat protein
MMGYSTREVASLLDLSERRIRALVRSGAISPARGPRNEYLFTFQDLVLLRTAAELSRAGASTRRIGAALTRLREQLPDDRSLSELRIHAAGDEIVVRENSEPPWNPASGQFHSEFDVAELAARVAPLGHADDDADRSAAEWFELGVDLEEVEPDAARAAYESALRLDGDLADARVNLGRLLHEAGLRAEAETQYRRVLAASEHALAAYNLGVLLEDAGRETDAVRSYGRALAADPGLAEAHYNLARIYEQRGDRRAAIRHLNGYRALVQRT